MKNRVSLFFSATALIIAIIAIWPAKENQSKNIAFIDNVRLYNSFKLKQHLEAKLTSVTNQRKAVTDSLKIKLDRMAVQIDANQTPELITSYRNLVDIYRAKTEEYTSQNEKMSQDFNDQVWTQLNQYVKDFGSQSNYSLVLGSSGNGNIMHAQESLDITEDLIAYANQQYQGK